MQRSCRLQSHRPHFVASGEARLYPGRDRELAHMGPAGQSPSEGRGRSVKPGRRTEWSNRVPCQDGVQADVVGSGPAGRFRQGFGDPPPRRRVAKYKRLPWVMLSEPEPVSIVLMP